MRIIIEIERTYTRDEQVPLVAGDSKLDFGWRYTPVPPSPDEGWKIFDNTHDKKTGWQRIVRLESTNGKLHDERTIREKLNGHARQ